MTIRQAAKLRAKFINTKRDLLTKNVSAIERKLYNAVLDKLISELEVSDGKIVNNNKNIDLTTVLDKIIKDFNNNEFAKVIRLFANDLLSIEGLNKTYFSIIEKDQQKLNEISKDVNKELNKKLGLDEKGAVKKNGYLDKLAKDTKLKVKLKKITYNAVIKGKPIDDFKKQMKTLVQGDAKVNGELTKHMNTFAYDTYQQFDRTAGEMFAEQLSLNAFIYNGGKIDTTREFCRERNGKVFTIDEAMGWKKLEWDGKNKNYNPLQDAGGYNCRHTLDYISNQMAIRLRPELKGKI